MTSQITWLIQVLYICCTSEVSLCTFKFNTAHSETYDIDRRGLKIIICQGYFLWMIEQHREQNREQ